MGGTGVCEFAGGLFIAAGGDVGLLFKRGLTAARHHQPNLCRHDALHVDRDCVYGAHVCVASTHFVAA